MQFFESDVVQDELKRMQARIQIWETQMSMRRMQKKQLLVVTKPLKSTPIFSGIP